MDLNTSLIQSIKQHLELKIKIEPEAKEDNEKNIDNFKNDLQSRIDNLVKEKEEQSKIIRKTFEQESLNRELILKLKADILQLENDRSNERLLIQFLKSENEQIKQEKSCLLERINQTETEKTIDFKEKNSELIEQMVVSEKRNNQPLEKMKKTKLPAKTFEIEACLNQGTKKNESNNILRKDILVDARNGNEKTKENTINDNLEVKRDKHDVGFIDNDHKEDKSDDNTKESEKPYSCKTCGKKFKSKFGMNCHCRLHTGEQLHKCTVCGKNFTTSFNLTLHSRIHTGERPFECTFCSKTFTGKGNLNKHLKSHRGEDEENQSRKLTGSLVKVETTTNKNNLKKKITLEMVTPEMPKTVFKSIHQNVNSKMQETANEASKRSEINPKRKIDGAHKLPEKRARKQTENEPV